MQKKRVSLTYRCSEDVYERLRKISFDRRVSIQALIGEALQITLSGSVGEDVTVSESLPSELRDASPKELDFLEKMLYFFRHASEDLVRSVHNTAAHVVKIGQREESRATKRGRATG